MVNFKIIDDQTVLEVSSTDSLEDVKFFLMNFEMESMNRYLPNVTCGYPVYCEQQKIGYLALSNDGIGLVIHHYTLGRVELKNRWDIRDFYGGEFDNRSPF